MAGAHLILVTRGSQDTLKISDEQAIEEYVKFYHMKVSSVLIPDQDKLPLAFYDSIARLSGGSSHIIKHPRFVCLIQTLKSCTRTFFWELKTLIRVMESYCSPVDVKTQVCLRSYYHQILPFPGPTRASKSTWTFWRPSPASSPQFLTSMGSQPLRSQSTSRCWRSAATHLQQEHLRYDTSANTMQTSYTTQLKD